MSQLNVQNARLGGLSIRSVTWYMALLVREQEDRGHAPSAQVKRTGEPYEAPSIPDPWDMPKKEQSDAVSAARDSDGAQREAASPVDIGAPEQPPADRTRTREPVDNRPDAQDHFPEADVAGAFWQGGELSSEEPLPWEMAPTDEEDHFAAAAFSSAQEQDDFARAMMYLSSDDDFLVTGVGKRTGLSAERAPALRDVDDEHLPARAAAHELDVPAPRAAAPIKMILIAALAVLVLAALGLAAWYFLFTDKEEGAPGPVNASVIYVGEESLGCVEDGLAIQAALDSAKEKVEASALLPAVLDKPIRIESQMVDARYLAPQKDMERAVLDACKVLVQAAGVYVDGRLVAVARSQAEAGAVMEEALAPFRELSGDGREIRDLQFAQDIQIKGMTALPEAVLDNEALRCLLISGDAQQERVYEVAAGDTLTGIAGQNEIALSQLRYANPAHIGQDRIQIGETLSLAPLQGLLTVQFTERVTEEIALPFDTVTETSSSMYTTQTKEKVAGKSGLREVVADRIYVAGVLVQEDILEETVISEPVARVVVRGTKKATNASGSTSYLWPTQGSISSRFGARWGRQHKGIDIAAATGTPIYAARDGKVTFSGTNGGYGKLIKIDHGGGVETRYAHCSVLKVSSGKSVKKGEIIALVGSTGTSTGPHLHFEVRVGGEAKNPLNYLPN